MHPLLRFTLDLFGDKQALTPAGSAQPAIESVEGAAFRHPRANRETRLCEALVAYEFKRGKRRTIGFSIRAEGLVVSAPTWVPLKAVEAALQEKARWIVTKLGDVRGRHERLLANSIDWRSGSTMPYLGAPLALVLDPVAKGRAARAVLHPSAPQLTAGSQRGMARRPGVDARIHRLSSCSSCSTLRCKAALGGAGARDWSRFSRSRSFMTVPPFFGGKRADLPVAALG